jgi:sulfur-oxidizing protein SoxY
MTRRGFLEAATAAMGSLCIRPARASPAGEHLLAGDPARLSAMEREHLPILHAPQFTINRDKVPLAIEMAHPMTADHYISALEVVDAADAVPGKGVFHFTPANGRVDLAFQARLDPGASELTVIAECNRHGRWSCRRKIEVDEGGSGCSGVDPAVGRSASEEIHAPAIRIPELVRGGRLRRGQVLHAQVKIHHPNRRSHAIREGRIDMTSGPLYLEQMEVFHGGERVSRFAMTAGLSDDPLITFAFLATEGGTLRVVFSNNRGQRLEATHEVRFS